MTSTALTQPLTPAPYSMEDGGKLRKEALKTNTKAALDVIAAAERAINPFGPSKARCAGLLGLVVCSALIVASLFVPSLAPLALAYALALPVAGFLFLYGGVETYNNMLVCADLRARVANLSFEQISVFKDSPQFKDSRDTKWFLGHLQESKQQPTSFAGVSA